MGNCGTDEQIAGAAAWEPVFDNRRKAVLCHYPIWLRFLNFPAKKMDVGPSAPQMTVTALADLPAFLFFLNIHPASMAAHAAAKVKHPIFLISILLCVFLAEL